MAQVINFKTMRKNQMPSTSKVDKGVSKIDAKKQDAQILFFTGVRYERAQPIDKAVAKGK